MQLLPVVWCMYTAFKCMRFIPFVFYFISIVFLSIPSSSSLMQLNLKRNKFTNAAFACMRIHLNVIRHQIDNRHLKKIINSNFDVSAEIQLQRSVPKRMHAALKHACMHACVLVHACMHAHMHACMLLHASRHAYMLAHACMHAC